MRYYLIDVLAGREGSDLQDEILAVIEVNDEGIISEGCSENGETPDVVGSYYVAEYMLGDSISSDVYARTITKWNDRRFVETR